MYRPSPVARFYCSECAKAYEAPGNCSSHSDEPLLDLADEDVRLMLDDQDGAAKMRHAAILVGVVAAVTFVTAVFVMWALDMLDVAGDVNFARILIVLAVGYYFAAFAIFRFKPKAPKLSPDEIEQLEAARAAG